MSVTAAMPELFTTATPREDQGAIELPWREPEPTATESPLNLPFEQRVVRFLRTADPQRHAIRSQIVRAIKNDRSSTGPGQPNGYIELTLQTVVKSTVPGRLDDGIDILAQIGPSLDRFASHALIHNPPSEANDDYWYVLIRALGRSTQTTLARSLIDLCTKLPQKGVREAAAEALRDLADPPAVARLKAMAQNDQSTFIRELAASLALECPIS